MMNSFLAGIRQRVKRNEQTISVLVGWFAAGRLRLGDDGMIKPGERARYAECRVAELLNRAIVRRGKQ